MRDLFQYIEWIKVSEEKLPNELGFYLVKIRSDEGLGYSYQVRRVMHQFTTVGNVFEFDIKDKIFEWAYLHV